MSKGIHFGKEKALIFAIVCLLAAPWAATLACSRRVIYTDVTPIDPYAEQRRQAEKDRIESEQLSLRRLQENEERIRREKEEQIRREEEERKANYEKKRRDEKSSIKEKRNL